METRLKLDHDWFPAEVPENVVIGPDSWLYSAFSFLHFKSRQQQAVRIGRSCGIYNGCFFDLGPEGRVEVGDFTALVGVIFATNGTVMIGNYCFMAHEVVIADHHAMAPPGDSIERLPTRTSKPAPIVVGDNVWIGAGATLLAGARIGDGAIIGAGAVIDFEVPPMTVAGGNPGRIVGTVPRADT